MYDTHSYLTRTKLAYQQAMVEFEDKWNATHLLNSDIINLYANKAA